MRPRVRLCHSHALGLARSSAARVGPACFRELEGASRTFPQRAYFGVVSLTSIRVATN
jgi:hypothetical protein